MRRQVQTIVFVVLGGMTVVAYGAFASGQPGDGLAQPTVADVVDAADPGMSPCGSRVYIKWIQITDTIEGLAWASHQVVVGTVVEELPSQFAGWINPEIDPRARHVVTDYVIEVESRLRGHSVDPLRVRRAGGMVGDCTVVEAEGFDSGFAVGDRVLLFLTTEDLEGISQQDTVHRPIGPQGIWRVTQDGTIQATSDLGELWLQDDPRYTAVAERIISSLESGSPPEDIRPRDRLVSLDRAPIPPDVVTSLPPQTAGR